MHFNELARCLRNTTILGRRSQRWLVVINNGKKNSCNSTFVSLELSSAFYANIFSHITLTIFTCIITKWIYQHQINLSRSHDNFYAKKYHNTQFIVHRLFCNWDIIINVCFLICCYYYNFVWISYVDRLVFYFIIKRLLICVCIVRYLVRVH